MQDRKILLHSMPDYWIPLCPKGFCSFLVEVSFTWHSTGASLLSEKRSLSKLYEAQKMHSRDGNFTVIFYFSV